MRYLGYKFFSVVFVWLTNVNVKLEQSIRVSATTRTARSENTATSIVTTRLKMEIFA